MVSSLNEKAELYYGGDFCIMTNHGHERPIKNYKKTMEKLKQYGK